MKPYVLLFSLTTSMLLAQNNVPSVNVVGEGEIYVKPDIVNITISIENEGTDVAYLKEKNGEEVAKVIQVLLGEIPQKNFQTQRVYLQKNYDYNTKQYKYVASQTIFIKLEDVSKYEKLMEDIFAAGVNRIDNVSFDVKDRKNLQNQARILAVENARQKALLYAVSLEQNIGKAIFISEETASRPIVQREMMLAAGSSSDESTLALGEIAISTQINVSFELLQ